MQSMFVTNAFKNLTEYSLSIVKLKKKHVYSS